MGYFKNLDIELNPPELHIKMDQLGQILAVNGLPVAQPVVARQATTDDTTEINRAAFRVYLRTQQKQKRITHLIMHKLAQI